MSVDELEKVIRDGLQAYLGLNDHEITGTIGGMGADSLDRVELIMWVEEETNTEISDERAERCLTMTVREAAEFLHRELGL